MKGYTAEDLKKHFERCGRIRIGKNEFTNDAGYWTGGTCNWGANHNLLEDSRTIANSFAKIDDLAKITEVLKNCHSNQEYEAKKANFIQKCDESINGLRPRCGPSSSMFGICIIWADQAMSPEVEKEIEKCKREVEKIKNAVAKASYKWVEELNRIQLEIDQIKKKMEETKRKAMNEKDPKKRAALLLEIEEDGKLLQQKYREHQEHSNKFGHIDPSKYVSGLVEAMKRAIEKSDKSGNGGGGGNPNRPNRPNKPGGDSGGNGGGGSGDLPDDDPNKPPRQKREKAEKDNSQMILMVVAVIVILFLMTNQPKPQRDEEFDYY